MDGVAHSHTDSILGVWPRGFPDSQEADVQVQVPGMVFPVLSDDPASLVPQGRMGGMCGRHLDISRQLCSNACLGKSVL